MSYQAKLLYNYKYNPTERKSDIIFRCCSSAAVWRMVKKRRVVREEEDGERRGGWDCVEDGKDGDVLVTVDDCNDCT